METSTAFAGRRRRRVDRCRVEWRSVRRRGRAAVRIVAALVLLVASGWGVWKMLPQRTVKAGWQEPLLVKVESRPFVHEVVERGEVESSNSVEIRCEVASRATAGTTILEIVPEGTVVAKGDFLAKLDDSALQTDLLQQQIICNNSEAQVIQARADVEAARLALEEYESGIFGQDEEMLESGELVAKENLRRAEEYLRYSQRLEERGYISKVQLEADKFAVEKAQKELDVALNKLKVLRQYTRLRMVNKLKADIATFGAQLRSKENTYKLDRSRLQLVEQQIAKCVIRAPADGQVVYAKETRSMEHVVGEGLAVRERQIMFTLPDPKRMRVAAKVHESRIDHVREGMEVNIKLDAFPDLKLRGVVRSVSDYPLPSASVYSAHIKEYAVDVQVSNPPDSLRPGLTAEVAVQVTRRSDAPLVPVYSVLEREGRHFCLLKTGSQALVSREVEIGPTNEEFAIIDAGLTVGEEIVANPHNYEEYVTFAKSDAVDVRTADEKSDAVASPATRAAASPSTPSSPATAFPTAGSPAGFSRAVLAAKQ